MKKFLQDALFAVLFGCLLVAPYEWWVARRGNGMTPIYTYLEEHSEEVKVLILGHSQTAAGLDPRLVADSAVNVSRAGRVIYFDRLLLEKYIDRMPNVSTVICPVHYSFAGPMYRFYEDRNVRDGEIFDHTRYLHLNAHRYPMAAVLAHSAFLSGKASVKALLKREINTPPASKQGMVDTLGYAPMSGHIAHGYERDLIQTRQKEFAKDLEAMARMCAERGVRFVMVTFPFSDEALGQVTPEGVENLREVAAGPVKKYGAEWFNYLADEQFCHDSTLFYDWGHFNISGAEAFSRRVRADLGL